MYREHKYRFNLVVLAAVMFVVATLVARMVAVFVEHRAAFLPDAPADLMGLAASLVLCGLARAAFYVQVGPNGLHATDGIGRYHDVSWGAMRRVKNILGFLWVPHGKPLGSLFFPIFLDDAAGFRAYVIAHAPEGNPLRTYLEGR